jgi:choice-of-anchor C domain-containing protein
MSRQIELLERRSLLSANLLVNGSFETPQIGFGASGQDFTDYTSGQIAGAGWHVTSNSVDIVSNKVGATFASIPAAGNQYLDLDGYAPGTISQTVTTKPGQRYTFRFAFTATPFGGAPVRTATVKFNGSTITSLSKDVTGETPSKPAWVYKQFTLTATSTSSTISFVGTSAGGLGIALDDISFTAIAAGRASISGQVFADGNGDGHKGIDAIGLSGWTVWIDINGNGTLDTGDLKVTTDHLGKFSIGQLAAGTYKVHIVQQTGWKLTTAPVLTITLANAQASTTSLFGEQPI